MNNRISTGMMYTQSVSLMLSKQSKLSHLEQQLATGQKLVSAKDDPVAAGTAVGMDRALAELDRLGNNANLVQNRLGLQENALTQAGEMMARVIDLTIQANNPAYSSDNLSAVSSELKSIQKSLLSLANSSDGSGRYLFGGTSDDAAPFNLVNGKVLYQGDQTQRQVEIAPDTYVSDAMPGSEVFFRIRTGDGAVDAAAAASNSGNAVLTAMGRTSAVPAWNGESFNVRFTAPGTYEVVDSSNTVIATGVHTPGEDISFAGVHMTIEGSAAAGDSFHIGPSGTRDIFATLDGMIAALDVAIASPSDRATQQNALQAGLRDVTRASERMIDARAAGGAQLMAIDNASALRESNAVTLESTLSSMRDLDYADAISRYQLESTALKAAQTIFSQMQSMSLFNMIR